MPARHRTRRNRICEIQALVLRRGGRANPVNSVKEIVIIINKVKN